jgi:hypothetical protein
MALAGIGSFLLVLLFPQGLKYFFRNWFAEIVRDIVVIALAGLISQKFAETLTQHAKSTKRPPR